MATTQQVEELLKKHTMKKTKLHALEPSTFGGSINENSREWMRKFVNYTSLNKVEDADKLIMLESLLDKGAQCWFANLDDATRKSWPDLKQRFEETYYNANSWVNDQRIFIAIIDLLH